MSAITFSTENLIALNKLELSVRRASGKRHSLSEERSLFDLIKQASISKSVQVEAAFLEFIQSLNGSQKDQLVYRGISFERPTPLQKERAKIAKLEGQQLKKTKSSASVTPITKAAKVSAAAKSSSQRIYRGRVVAQ